jgi:hypothetical protein
MKEKLENIWLLSKNQYRRFVNQTKQGNDFDYSRYKLVSTLTDLTTYNGYSWGQYHPDQLWQYFDDDMVKYEDGVFLLRTLKKPKQFDDIVIPFATGVVSSSHTYMYGYFETDIFFPTSNQQWPAFWLTGSITWPPEIDVVEAYSKNDDYGGYRRFQPNIHYGDKMKIGAINIPLPKSLCQDYIKFGMEWQADYIKFYYNGYLVKVVYDKKVLDAMNQPMRVIINSAVQQSDGAGNSVTAFTSPKIYQ